MRHIITAIASGCARAFARPARRPSATTSCSSSCCFAPFRGATSNRWPKTLIATFGSFAEVISAPPARLAEDQRPGRGRDHRTEDRPCRGDPPRARAGAASARCCHRGRACIDYCRTTMAFAEKEQFRVLFLDKRNQLIVDELQQTGTVDHTPVYPREVVKRALELSATALILVHNHPSGDPTPSHADIQMTRTIVEVAKPLRYCGARPYYCRDATAMPVSRASSWSRPARCLRYQNSKPTTARFASPASAALP